MSDSTIHIHHVGGRDGELGEFPINPFFRGDMHFHIYDCDPDCLPQVEELNSARGNIFTVHNYVVSDHEGNVEFSINYCPCTSSLLPAASFKNNQYSPMSLLGDYMYRDAFSPVESFRAQAITLDSMAAREGLVIDFLSVDTQGSEDRVFAGSAERLLHQTIGVLSEVELHGLYQDQPLFGDIHALLRKSGFNFMRMFLREARVNYFRAGVGFRGDGMLMSADALFLKDPDHVEIFHANPLVGLIKLAYVALSFGYVEYALDSLERASRRPGAQEMLDPDAAGYPGFLAKVWRLYRETPFIPQPSFAEMFTPHEARQRFEVGAKHPWQSFDRDRVLRTYFAGVDTEAFRRTLPTLLDPADTEFETLLRHHALASVADVVKDKRLRHAAMIVESLGLGTKAGERYRLHVDEVLAGIGLPIPPLEAPMTREEVAAETDRLSRLSGWEGGPSEGWQYPFDLGHGIVAKTYTDVQATMHPWRKNVLLNNLDSFFAGRYDTLSVLDLGACEGAMALALWERGVRDITCVEARDINVQKARFVFKVRGADIPVVHADVTSFLQDDQRKYDLILFMGLLYHLLDPFMVTGLAARRSRGVMALETVLAKPTNLSFDNAPHYSPSNDGFFIRHDLALGNTAGLSDLELWPTRGALELMLREVGFANVRECDYGRAPIDWYASGQRTMLLAWN